MFKIIQKISNDKTFCEIYEYGGEGDTFHVGRIIAADKSHILIASVTPYGKKDGFQCVCTENVMKLQYGTQYLKGIEKIIDGDFKINAVEFNCEDVFNDFVKYIISEKLICNVISDYESCYGYIKKISNDVITLCLIDDNGERNGYAVIKKDDIECVSIKSEDEVKLEKIIK